MVILPSPGLINEDGTINWDCPCLGGMASGPCGVEFRESFTCFHYSKEEPKGSDCLEPFRTLHDCMTKYPDYYGRKTGSRSSGDEDDDEEEDNDSEQKTGNKSEESSSDKSLQSGVTESAEAKEGKSL